MRTEFLVGLDRFFRIDVDRTHEPLRQERADGQNGEPERTQLLAGLSEMGPVARVAGEVNSTRWSFEDIAHPEGALAIVQPASGKVATPLTYDSGPSMSNVLTPVEFFDVREAAFTQEGGGTQFDDEQRVVFHAEGVQRGKVGVVVVVVTQQHDVDRGS